MDKRVLRKRDFWTALVLIGLCLFFLAETARLPFFEANAAGVESGRWYNSAAIAPFGVFGALLALSLGLLWVSARDGGAAAALAEIQDAARWLGWSRDAAITRALAIAAMLLLYIFGLVPRVDFVIASALMITALIYGFHEGRAAPLWIALTLLAAPSLYALIAHFPQSEWAKPHDDDWATLIAFAVLVAAMLIETRRRHGHTPRYARWAPLVALLAPLLLVLAMAFGFRQNVPNRTGLLFGQIEYHYYVTLRPLWSPARR